MAKVSPGSRRRLGAELRRLRTDRKLTLDEVAERMTCSTSKISRLETGKGIPKVPDVRELLRIYGVLPGADQVLSMARAAVQLSQHPVPILPVSSKRQRESERGHLIQSSGSPRGYTGG